MGRDRKNLVPMYALSFPRHGDCSRHIRRNECRLIGWSNRSYSISQTDQFVSLRLVRTITAERAARRLASITHRSCHGISRRRLMSPATRRRAMNATFTPSVELEIHALNRLTRCPTSKTSCGRRRRTVGNVQAPAGSGKTTLLVQRFLNLLAVVERPEEILAITFTRKAAAEMLERVVAAVAEDDDRSRAIRARSIARGWHLETLPARLRIQTIDAFCVGLVQRLPVSSGLGDRLRIVEDGEPFYREAVDKTFDRLGHSFELNPELVALLTLFANDFEKARASMSAMLAKRDQWLEVVALTLRAGQSDRQAEEFAGARSPTRSRPELNCMQTPSDITADLTEYQRETCCVAGDAALKRTSTGSIRTADRTRTVAFRRGADDDARWSTARPPRQRTRIQRPGRTNQSAKARLRALIDDLAGHDMIVRLASLGPSTRAEARTRRDRGHRQPGD
jgi:hypothetical protein